MLHVPVAAIGPMAGIRAVGGIVFIVSAVAEQRRRRAEHQQRVGSRGAASAERDPTGVQLARSKPTQHQLDGVDLRDANLRRSRLQGLELAGRDLTGSDLTSARLDRADLSGAVLDRCDLSWASLRGCDLRSASLAGTQMLDVDLREALLQGADLRTISGLETVFWRGAMADRTTRWPDCFDPREAGVVIERTGRSRP